MVGVSIAIGACSRQSTPEITRAAAAPTTAQHVADTPTAPVSTVTAATGHTCSPEEQKARGCVGMKDDAGGKGCNQWDEAAAAVTRRDVPSDAVWVSFPVDGMVCGGCERRIQAKVGEIDGVVAVEASAELGRVRVALRPDAKDRAAEAKARVAALGYKVGAEPPR